MGVLVHSVDSIILLTCVSVIIMASGQSPTTYPTHTGTDEHTGDSGYTTYLEGTGPIIFLVQHGGYEEPSGFTVRENGCYDSTKTPDCNYTSHDCGSGGDSECSVTTGADSNTVEMAQCLASKTHLVVGSTLLTSHLIINDLARDRLDPNRQLEEGAQGYSNAEQVWYEIHGDPTAAPTPSPVTSPAVDADRFVWDAKTIAKTTSKCGFGIIFDIHGQGSNDYNHFGYKLTGSQLSDTNANMNLETNNNRKRSSIGGLVTVTGTTNNIADIIRGPNSLGSLLENKLTGNNGNNNDYKVIPSANEPDLSVIQVTDPDFKYYTGGFTIKFHGSSVWNTVDDGDNVNYTPNIKSTLNVEAIQIEINSNIRKSENGSSSDQFCNDLSEAIEQFVNFWYETSLDDCE